MEDILSNLRDVPRLGEFVSGNVATPCSKVYIRMSRSITYERSTRRGVLEGSLLARVRERARVD